MIVRSEASDGPMSLVASDGDAAPEAFETLGRRNFSGGAFC